MITGHWYMIVVLLLIVLIFYGPGKLPEIGGAVGKAIREFRKSSAASDAGQVSQAPSELAVPAAAPEVKQSAEPDLATGELPPSS
jgi:sec-independent protein translocase protein TatA